MHYTCKMLQAEEYAAALLTEKAFFLNREEKRLFLNSTLKIRAIIIVVRIVAVGIVMKTNIIRVMVIRDEEMKNSSKNHLIKIPLNQQQPTKMTPLRGNMALDSSLGFSLG